AMNRWVGNVEAFGLLAGDVWAPEHPTYLYNTLFDMAAPYPYMDQDAVELEAENDAGGDDQSHIIDLIEKFLDEVDRDDEAIVAKEDSAGQGNGPTIDHGVLPELPEPDVAAAGGASTVGETLAPPVVASQSESGAPVASGGTQGRSGLPWQRRGRRGRRHPKKAPSVSLAGAGESCSTPVLIRRAQTGAEVFPATTAEVAAAAPRGSTARSAKERKAETETLGDSGESRRQQLGRLT
uniref:Uncharacterized protein n=1 Tax=Aegilops tauschii subsp. strangulata TaxID=200361 RepID=A0A453CF29_AEGTS